MDLLDEDRRKLPIIQSNPEQSKAASVGIDDESVVAMSYLPAKGDFPWTWKVEFITDDWRAADKWWEAQTGLARVYYGTGAIRNAK